MLEQWFKERVGLVTGGADGIGKETALLLARRGCVVAVADVNREAGEAVVAAINAEGGTAAFFYTDVASKHSVAEFVDSAVKRFGKIDVAFNNAGITHPRDAEWDDEAFRTTMAINVDGVNQCMKHQIPHLLKSGNGAIVNTASVHGFIANPVQFLPSYTASKHAVIGLTKAVALEYAKRKIRVNAICPGVTLTSMLRQSMERDEATRKMLEAYAPIGRIANPSEIAEVAVWLASDGASYVTGHALVADGGFLTQ